MKFKNYKKTIILGVVFVLVIISTAVGLKATLSSYKDSYYFDRMIKLIMDDEERKLNKSELETFRKNIISEVESISDVYLLEKAYYALGAIEYLEGNYEKSIEFLIKSSNYNPENLNNIDLMIYSALSTNYMKIGELEISEKYFEYAKSIAINKKLNSELVNIYYGRAKSILNSNGNLNDVIELMEESNKLKQSYTQRIRSNLLLSTMYRLKGEYDISLDYDEEALNIALDYKDDKNINACIINLGENYYVRREYNKVIYIYESLLQSKRVKEPNNKLNIYAYLLESYFEVGKEEKVDHYKEMYLNELKNIDEEDRNRELIWIYMVLSDINIKNSNFEIGERYYNNANELYKKIKKIHMQIQICIWKSWK
ncbi:tetratricopeptide repeat protein [Clostridium sp. B9]|uniref:tetratricopeptide repeat protein n=1 Tax=Clostridium sp. B9 TaxID=3423224 RepID=UPI003D2ECF3E